MICKLLRNPSVIEFLQYLAFVPAAWILGNYSASWVIYVEGSVDLLHVLYGAALILLMVGMLSPVALIPKKWQLLASIPLIIGVLTFGMPHLNELKGMADAHLEQTKGVSVRLIEL
jgi:hypothetical protein